MDKTTANKQLILLVLLVLLLCLSNSYTAQTHPLVKRGFSKTKFYELLVKVNLNRQELTPISLVLQDKKKRTFVSYQDLVNWNLTPPDKIQAYYKGVNYYQLDLIDGLSYRLNRQKMTLTLNASAKLFNPQQYNIPDNKLKAQRPDSIGGYLNYNLNIPPEKRKFLVNGLFDAGIFGPVGVINTDFLANSSLFRRNVLGEDESISPVNQGVIRLNSTWTIDNPETMVSVRLGDSLTQPGMWGNAVGFGGIQISTNFATQPRFISYPLPTIAGEAVMPSIVDLYVDNARIYQQQISPGPFDINSLPVVTGQGEVSLVTRDLLGRQQVIAVPYYASSNLLKPGLTDFSFEAGVVRNNLGIASNDYGQFVMTGTYRRGINPHLTAEAHAAFERYSQAVGAGLTYLIGNFALIDGAIALSRSKQGMGGLLEVGLEHRSNRYNFGSDITVTSDKFEQLGQSQVNLPPKLQGTVFFGVPLAFNDSLGLSLVSQINRVEHSANLFSANYTRAIAGEWNLILSGLTNIGGTRTRAAFLTLTKRFGSHNIATVNANDQNGKNQAGFQFNHNSLTPNGLDYYASALPGKNGNVQGGANLGYEFGDYSIQVANQNNRTSYTANANGSIAYLSHQVQFTKRITSSFGIVQVPGFEGIGVYVDNQLIAHTNRQGYAFLPDLRAYDDNKVTIDPAAIPMNAIVAQDEIHAVPYYHSGVTLQFDIHPDRDALFKVKLSSGKWLPAGAAITVNRQTKSFPSAYRGEVYVTGLKPGSNTITATWDGNQCQALVNYQQSDNPLPHLGTIICH